MSLFYNSRRPFLKKICICLHDWENAINKKQKKWSSKPCCGLAWVCVCVCVLGCRCNLIWIRMLWLWGIKDKKRRDNKDADRAAGDWNRGEWGGGSGNSSHRNTLDGMHAMEKKHIQHLHMFFPFPLIRSLNWGHCPAQLHMKQSGRKAGLWQRRAISRIPINLWQPLQYWTLH